MIAGSLFGMPERQVDRHRGALGGLAKQLEPLGLRCRPVERLRLGMEGWYRKPEVLPPELDVYGGGRLIATVTVAGAPRDGEASFLVREPGALPVGARGADAVASAVRDIATARTEAAPEPGRSRPRESDP
ncbi:hypothetical protein Ssi03_19690 [Sphaerisporangium siamense]|uniref:Uncharacterized protein n=1 Tax=Sphaerisporangium siamense TaxID=795645 RepID=A0A7W7DGA1_9ACTN|nr:hypothetical protein [Sphaerisporangium siamense]MBB4705171.1 hypothetical protein [Sphaerisporangium siamense]GII83979.1 hypothetical protein Ssi03_19690 [Sphaerisporangium siamense]